MDTDQVIDRFEAAWQQGSPPDIGEFLGLAAAPSMSGASRQNLLIELVMVDLWYRWRQASGRRAATAPDAANADTWKPEGSTTSLPGCPRLEDYVRQFPQLGPLEEVPPVVIGEEYRARQQWGDRPAREDYLARFSRQAPQLEQLLDEIDRELAGATAPSPPTSPAQAKPVATQPGAQAPGGRPSAPAKIGKYHVVGALEEGGQAQVYRAIHPNLTKELVIKLGRQPAGAGSMDQLVAEGRVLAELDHPNLARVYDLDFHEGRPFVVMEYVRGRNLRHCARQHPYGPREAASLVARIARAVSAAHARGIIHQDIKPGNVLIDESGEPRLIDFGLARLRPAWVEAPEAPGGISGTVQYMSPEQARGETDQIDPRSDVFALGALLYFLLVGQAPFADENALASLERARRCDFDDSVLRVAGVPRRLEAICLRAMQADPADRYASAEQMAADLERFLSGPRRRNITLAVTAGLILAALAFFAAWRMRGDGAKSPSAVSQTTTSSGPTARGEPDDPAITLLGRPLRHDFVLDFEIIGHKTGEGDRVVLTEKERVAFRIRADRDCYVGVWHVDHHRQVTRLFPSKNDPDHFLPADEPRTVPGDMKYAIQVTHAEGPEYLHVVACTDRWEMPPGEPQGPYVVSTTPDKFERWRTQVRGMVLAENRSPAVSEQLLVLDVQPPKRP